MYLEPWQIFNSHQTCEKFSVSSKSPNEFINITITRIQPYQRSDVGKKKAVGLSMAEHVPIS